MFKVTMLPAHVGDAIWIEYGPKEGPHRVLIDGGTSPTAAEVLNGRIEKLGAGAFELLIVTHIDTDHIGGIVSMLRKLSTPKVFKQVWFNGWINLAPETKEFLGPIDGEKLTTLIHDLKLPWNEGFDTDDHAIRTSALGPHSRAGTFPEG